MPSLGEKRMDHIETASELLGMTNSDFIDWISSFQPDYKTYISDSGVGCFYTDGDDGLIWFDPDCESFDDEGLRVEVMGKYCDIDFQSMLEIHQKLSGWNYD